MPEQQMQTARASLMGASSGDQVTIVGPPVFCLLVPRIEVERANGTMAFSITAGSVEASLKPRCGAGRIALGVDTHELWREHPGELIGVPTGAASGFDATSWTILF
jgi:hypothetical protein